MPIIKRYPNRKLYDTESKKYVTLDGISDLIRQGQEVQVLDHATGEDLTTLTLTQIIFEQEKKQSGFLPRSVLTGLVRAGGQKISTIRHSLTSPLDLIRHAESEIDRRIGNLIRRGELNETEGKLLRHKLLEHAPESDQTDMIDQLLANYNIPSRRDLERLEQQLEELTYKLNAIIQPPTEAP